MNKRENFWRRPGWLFFLLLPLLHFASINLTFLCAVTPEQAVVVWLPNAVLLAALLRFNGQRAVLMAALTFTSDILANLQHSSLLVSVLYSMVNLLEVSITYQLMRRSGASFRLQRQRDLLKFVLAGPVAGALIGAVAAAVIVQQLGTSDVPFLKQVSLWWFADALGLLIYVPLLVSLTQLPQQSVRLTSVDDALLILTLLLATVVMSAQGGAIAGIPITPTLLLPAVALIAVRCGIRLTTLVVVLISLATATMITTGQKPFGDLSVEMEKVRAQEFILVLSLLGIGIAVLHNELRLRQRDLERRLRCLRPPEAARNDDRFSRAAPTTDDTGTA